MPLFLQVIFLSAVPLIEQRGAIPLGILNHMNPIEVFFLSLFGSLLPVLPILFLIEKFYLFASKTPKLKPLVKIIDKKVIKNSHKFNKYKELALITFVAVPLPTTGLYTGSLIAGILKFDRLKAFACILIGGILSAGILTLIFSLPK